MGCACSTDVNEPNHQAHHHDSERWDGVAICGDGNASKQAAIHRHQHRQGAGPAAAPILPTSTRRDSDDDALIALVPSGFNPLDVTPEPPASSATGRHRQELKGVDADHHEGDDCWMPSGSVRKTNAELTTTTNRHLQASGVRQQPPQSSFSASCDMSRGRAHRPGSCSVWPGQFGSSAAGMTSFSAMDASNPPGGVSSSNAATAAVAAGGNGGRQQDDNGSSPAAGLCLFAPLEASPGAGGPAQTPYLSAGTPASTVRTLTPAVVCAASTVRTSTTAAPAAGAMKNGGWPAAAHTVGFMVTIVADTPPPTSLLLKDGGHSSCYGGAEDAGDITIVLPPPAATSAVALSSIQTAEPANLATTSANDDDTAVAAAAGHQHSTSDVSPGTSSHHRRQKSTRSQLVTTARRSAVVDFYNARLEESMMLSNGITSSESLQREFGSLMASDRSLVLGSNNNVSGACAGAKSRSFSNNPTNPSIATSVSSTSAAVGRPIQVSATSLYGRSFSSGLSILNGFVSTNHANALPAAAGLPPKAPRGASAGSSKHPSPSTGGRRRRRAVASTPLLPEAARNVDELIDALFAVPCIVAPSQPL